MKLGLRDRMRAERPRRLFLLAVGLAACSCSSPERDEPRERSAHRRLSALCLPCGNESSVVVVSRAELDELFARFSPECRASGEAAEWLERVEAEAIDFEEEALVVMWDMIGTSGAPTLDVESPEAGALHFQIQWEVPDGPALPVATAACCAVAVDKSIVTEVTITTTRERLRRTMGSDSSP